MASRNVGDGLIASFGSAIQGFVADLTPAEYESLASDPNVVGIEPEEVKHHLEIVRRLDQMLGWAPELIIPVSEASPCVHEWIFDEPVNTQDFWALRKFGTEFWRGVGEGAGKGSARFAFRADISRPEWQRDLLDGVTNVDVVSGTLREYPRRVIGRNQRDHKLTYMYGTVNKLGQPLAINAAGCGSAMKEYGHLLRDDPAWAAQLAVRHLGAAAEADGHQKIERQEFGDLLGQAEIGAQQRRDQAD